MDFFERNFDPRAWNLFAGAAMLLGCGHDIADADTDTTVPTDGTTDATSTGDGDGDGDYYCLECCYDEECPPFSVCDVDNSCQLVGSPPPSCGLGPFDIPTIHQPDAPPLALSFADIDDDGQDELVVATQMELLVYEFGSDVPSISPRMPAAAGETRMIAGQFDGQPGEDVILLVADEYHRYFSDSIASLISPSVAPSPLPDASFLLGGEFDALAPTDVLVWGSSGAMLDFGGATVSLTMDEVVGAAVFDYGSPASSVALLRPAGIFSYDFMGNQQAQLLNGSGHEIGSLDGPGQHLLYHAQVFDFYDSQWYAITLLGPQNLTETMVFFVPHGSGTITSFDGGTASGDFDGDQFDDLLLSFGWANSMHVVFDVFGAPCMASYDLGLGPVSSDIAVGDHDGDGDDEAALIQGEHVAIVDF